MTRLIEEDLSTSSALVVDANPTSRSILINQLRDFGFGTVNQCSRIVDARRQLEFKTYDLVLCEQYFGKDASTGQDLLDDLRRNQLLPFSTVFIMVTAEATYAKVAEAAESALDGYLLKPHTAVSLAERVKQARARKLSLKDIFEAIEAENFEQAAQLCQQRFESRGRFWLYAARIGAELLLRLEKYAEAQALFEAVVEARTLPWAKLGVARSLLEAGETGRAATTLERLTSEEPNYADAYDVLGRAQFELGQFERALDIYKMACDLTPYSISRLQNLGMITYYSGNRVEAEKVLGRAARTGLDSKMFDPQTLVLLAFARLEMQDRKGLSHCRDDFVKLIDRDPKNPRLQRLAGIVDILILIQDRQFSKAVEAIRAQEADIKNPEFDFESASNLLVLLSQLASNTIQLDEVSGIVDTLGMRFCTTRSMSELLAGAAALYPAYQERLHACSAQVLKLAENALALSMGGNPAAAVKQLLAYGNDTLNAKLIETAHLVLQRYAAKIPDAAALTTAVQDIRVRLNTFNAKPMMGDPKRQAGGVALRTAKKEAAE